MVDNPVPQFAIQITHTTWNKCIQVVSALDPVLAEVTVYWWVYHHRLQSEMPLVSIK